MIFTQRNIPNEISAHNFKSICYNNVTCVKEKYRMRQCDWSDTPCMLSMLIFLKKPEQYILFTGLPLNSNILIDNSRPMGGGGGTQYALFIYEYSLCN